MAQVLRQRRWRLTVSVLAMVAWMLGTNFCALGLMARPCSTVAAPTVSECPHCPAKSAPADPVPAAPCCQEVRADLPPTAVASLPALSPVQLPTDWANVFSLLLATAPGSGDSRTLAVPDNGPPEGERAVALRVLLGRCAPVNAPPALG